jgi:hypothetical protein
LDTDVSWRPIANRPQIDNLPHQACRAFCNTVVLLLKLEIDGYRCEDCGRLHVEQGGW